MYIQAAIINVILGHVLAIIGYDCGGRTLNITTFSALDKPDCDSEGIEPITEVRNIQLLQLADFKETAVEQCNIEIDRTIFYCGMHSHVSIVNNGRQQYISTISREDCRTLHNTGTIFINTAIQVTGVLPNSTTTRSLTLAGIVNSEGTCSGTTYSDPYGTWTGVVVQAVARISLKNYVAPVKLSTNEVILHSGQRCKLQLGHCLDSEDGFSYWDSAPVDSCNFNGYDVLYDGKATRITPPGDKGPIVYTVASEDAMFALTETSRITTCGYTLAKTEHPKLFILEITQSGRFKEKARIPVSNLDIFTYVNSKFVYVEKHMKVQIKQLYQDLVKQRCLVEQQVLQNALALIHSAPEEVAIAIARAPGYMIIPSGEALHLVKCIPVICQIRKTEECYNELPVTYNNASYFLLPRTHILSRTGTRKSCYELMPTLYKLQGTWYRLSPKLVESLPPQPLAPLTKSTWKYIDPKNLANGGIYSHEDLENLKEHIMFPIERGAIVSSLAQGATGRQYTPGAISMFNLIDEESLEKIAKSAGSKMWEGFISFGSFSAGVIGIYIIIRLVKGALSTIVNGFALHATYGWGLHLLGAIWGSLTTALLFRGQNRETANIRNLAIAPLDEATPQADAVSQTSHSNNAERAASYSARRWSYNSSDN
ncbi:uncharacterized protein LOC143340594 [Colletes latitarsis]|uniref:uncharacterized protein LOC143340594 n=1 Tax=Colletes latitarsis TaxID=2605962 RepID=UPI0040353F8B